MSKSRVLKQNLDKNKKGTNKWTILWFVLPALLIYVVYTLYPIIATFNYSLLDWNGASGISEFVGIQNYINLFADSSFWQALENNMLLVVVSVFIQIPLGLVMALVLFSDVYGKRLLNVVFFLPYLMSTIAIGLLWVYLYSPESGPINKIATFLGLGDFEWLGNADLAMLAVLIVIIWQFSPFYMILFKAAIVGIPEELYEAAKIDGASSTQQFFFVTFPALIPTIVSSSVLAVVGSLKSFDIIYIMTGGGPGNATEILGTYMYKQGFVNLNMGYASTIAAVMFIIAFIAVVIIQLIDYLRKKKGVFL
ncbi:carbohydrate ABC transporter permease [Oceanobacillus neutriphilus]|uniref:Sugar ABC transporter permease n=1 Tax=Oceanobacillus neutriphilus TaxID=531815 RepID=A0ABQ2P280_9BACI|nr:sugar ABC transporter permease [Oceanobacillus neutriphilus]GGP16398.1 sugar ABC transporter permease [Oceanobacillus neutriphilus]